ncbi:phage tail protein, partial [Bacillus cereus]
MPLEVEVTLKGASSFDLRKRLNELNSILDTEEEVPIVFADEPEMTYYGMKESVEELLETDRLY